MSVARAVPDQIGAGRPLSALPTPSPHARHDRPLVAGGETKRTFEADVRPILKAHCFHCHGEAGTREAKLDLRLRRLIVKGAVDMVSDALTSLTDEHDIELDEERRASMISNLLVVICSEQQTQPVINAGSLY